MLKAIPPLLVVVHAILLAWAAIGMAEWLLPAVPWPLVSNPAFPPWLLLVHWLAVFTGAIAFLGGYIARWRATPAAVALAYAFMAVVCVIETFWFLTGVGRFVAMALEFATYIGIVVLLRRLPSFVNRFSGRRG
ncbi:MAG TPA: hypothetical protein VFY22_03770 [Hydrogenophaga sp.]|nr:hypothetical protein [Hydrogenophaga sp.]